MYYYKVKENSVIKDLMTQDKEAIDKIYERADRFSYVKRVEECKEEYFDPYNF